MIKRIINKIPSLYYLRKLRKQAIAMLGLTGGCKGGDIIISYKTEIINQTPRNLYLIWHLQHIQTQEDIVHPTTITQQEAIKIQRGLL